MKNNLKIGDRVRAKVRTMIGWKGTGVVVGTQGGTVEVQKDDGEGLEFSHVATFCRREVAKIRKPA